MNPFETWLTNIARAVAAKKQLAIGKMISEPGGAGNTKTARAERDSP